MQIVIELSEEFFNEIKHVENGSFAAREIIERVKNGTPLPKGHGRLIDADSC